MSESKLNQVVRGYWEQELCGTSPFIVGDVEKGTKDWFERVENYRYAMEPFIHSVAQFTRHAGKKVLEVGAGTDHLQWARAGAECYGVDLTDSAIETTKDRLAFYGHRSTLQRMDAEKLPFLDNTFDVVYAWGVIHHSERPKMIIGEIQRVLKPGGIFIGMVYGRHSLWVWKYWIKYALLKGKPWRSFGDVVWHHIESHGTKAYTVPELKRLFGGFEELSIDPILTPYDVTKFPKWLSQFFPASWGWFITVRGVKP